MRRRFAPAFGAVLGTISAALLAHALGRRLTYFVLSIGSLLICAYLFRWHFAIHPILEIGS